jgi:hypothetical protein
MTSMQQNKTQRVRGQVGEDLVGAGTAGHLNQISLIAPKCASAPAGICHFFLNLFSAAHRFL